MPMRFIGGPGRSDVINNMVPASLLSNIFYKIIEFQDTNGFTLALTGTGACTLIEAVLKLATALGIGSTARLSLLWSIPSFASGQSIFTWNKKRTIRTAVLLSSDADQTLYITSGGINPAADRFIGFKIVNNIIRGCVGNGAAETLVDPGYGIAITPGAQFLLEARFIPGVECRFYVNGGARGVLTTGLPSGTPDSNRLIDCYVRSDSIGGANKEVSFDFWEFYQAR